MTKTKQVLEGNAADAAFDEDFLPLILKEKKEELEADGWTFDYDEKEGEWSAAKPGAVGGEGCSELSKLIGFIEKHNTEEPSDKTIETSKHLESQTHVVEWSYLQKIAETNSCGRISENASIHNPFEFEFGFYLCIGSASSGITGTTSANACALISESDFQGKTKNYIEAHRDDEGGFYHGMRVKKGKEKFVLSAPELKFELSFDFDELLRNGWEIERHEDGFWFAEKAKQDGDPVKLFPFKTPEEMFKAVQDYEKFETDIKTNHLDPPAGSGTDENEPGESVEPKAASLKTPLPMFAVESCRFELSDEEILKRTYSMRHAQAELRAEEVRHAREKDIYKSNKKMIEARVESLGQRIDTKSEYRELECPLEYDFQKESVITRRPDTGEVISRRGMTKEERQKRLF